MKINGWFAVFATLSLVACASNPNKAEKIETTMERTESITGEVTLGVKGGNLVVQKKVLMAEELRSLQNAVYETEDHVYGNRKYGSKGLYGVLQDCRVSLADKRWGGDGHLSWTEPLDRVTDKEEDFSIGIDESNKIVGISEEFLKDRIQRFRSYRQVLEKREDDLDEKVKICETGLKAHKYEVKKAELADSAN